MKIPSQKDEVLWWLQKHGSITAFEGFNKLYIIDLAGCIRDLRFEYNITDEWVHKKGRLGRPVSYKKYIYLGKKEK